MVKFFITYVHNLVFCSGVEKVLRMPTKRERLYVKHLFHFHHTYTRIFQ